MNPESTCPGRLGHSFCRWCYASIPIEQLCRIAVRLGYGGIDLVDPVDFHVLRKHNLIGTMTPTHSLTAGLNNPKNWPVCLEAIRRSIDATADAGFPNVICFSGNANGVDPDEGLRNCAEAIKQVMPLVEARKLTLHMELLNSKVDHPDYQCDRTAWGVRLVDAVASDRFKLLYDIYHMQIMEGDICSTIQKYHAYFGHYHTGGVPGRNEIDASQELNYPAIVRAIAETGFEGWLAQEFVPAGDPEAGLAEAKRICEV